MLINIVSITYIKYNICNIVFIKVLIQLIYYVLKKKNKIF